jgi:hypothetical protein
MMEMVIFPALPSSSIAFTMSGEKSEADQNFLRCVAPSPTIAMLAISHRQALWGWLARHLTRLGRLSRQKIPAANVLVMNWGLAVSPTRFAPSSSTHLS